MFIAEVTADLCFCFGFYTFQTPNITIKPDALFVFDKKNTKKILYNI